MAFFEFPHTRTYDSDLGWLIAKVKEMLATQASQAEIMATIQAWQEENEPRIEHIEEMYALFEEGQLPAEIVDALENWLNQYGVLGQAKAYSDGLYNTERGQRISADNLLQTQIDELVAPTGTAPNPAEVVNGRIGADNITYASIGDAIRANDVYNRGYSNYITEGDTAAFQAPGIIGSGNTWVNPEDTHLCIPIANAERIYIRSQTANVAVYAFLTSDDYTTGTTPAFVTATTRSVLSADRDATIFVPSGSQYLYLHYITGGVNMMPISLKIDRVPLAGSYTHYGADFINDKLHNIYMLGLLDTYKEYEEPCILTGSHIFGSMGSTHISIPVHNAKHLIIKAGSVNTIMAFLRDDASGFAQSAMYTYIPGTTTEDRNRILLEAGKVYFYDVPEGCTAIYLHCGNNPETGTYLPAYMQIDEHVIVNTSDALNTVFYDDFSGDLSKWKFLQADKDAMRGYYSRYYTDTDDCYIRDGVLTLRCMEDPDLDLGVADVYDTDGHVTGQIPRKFKAGYISTEDTFAIASGAISARIKTSTPLTDAFPFTFFTFGQNNKWPFAPEYDIIEQTSHNTTEEVTLSSGNTYPAGTQVDSIGSFIHYTNGAGVHTTIDTYSRIKYAGVTEYDLDPDYDPQDWHVYKVIWNASTLCLFIDDRMVRKTALSGLSTQSDFLSPADIRLNIKAHTWSNGDHAELFVDWVKAESFNPIEPVTGLQHSNMNLLIGEEAYIGGVTVPADATNQAFVATTNDTSIVELTNYLPDYTQVLHKIKGLAAGSATVTIKTADDKIAADFTVTVS